MGKMLVLGAAANHDRYSHKAVKSLIRNGFEAVAVGFKTGFINDVEILTGLPEISDVGIPCCCIWGKNGRRNITIT